MSMQKRKSLKHLMRKFLHFLAVVGLVIAGIIALVSLFAFVFLKTWKPFGGKAGKADRKNSWCKNCDADSLGCDYSFTAEKEEITVITPYIGQTANIETPMLFTERWWRRNALSLMR